MSIIRKSFIGIFLLFFSNGFAEEIFQGNLKNGMRYYVCPNMEEEEITISFVIKEPSQFVMAADISSLNPFDRVFDSWQGQSQMEYSLFSAQISQRHFQRKLSQLSEHFTNNFYLEEVIEKIREEYEESKSKRLKENNNSIEFLIRFYCIDFEYCDKVFSQENEEIIKVCNAYFEPSRMALIISGPVKPFEIIAKLQRLFGEKVGDGLFLDSVKFKVEKPIALKIRAYAGADEWLEEDDELEDEEESFQESNVYFYPLNPSFKDAVLNDLFFLTNFGTECPVSFSPGTIFEGSSFPFINEIIAQEIDEFQFSNAKATLERFYQYGFNSNMDECVQHFLSGFPTPIENFNLGFLSELENVTLEDLNSFIDEHIKNIPITGEYEIRM